MFFSPYQAPPAPIPLLISWADFVAAKSFVKWEPSFVRYVVAFRRPIGGINDRSVTRLIAADESPGLPSSTARGFFRSGP